MRNGKIVSLVVVALLLLSLIPLIAPSASAQGEEIYSTDQAGTRRSEFLENKLIYFDVFADANTQYRVRLRNENDEIVEPQREIVTDDDGNYISSEEGVFLNHEGVGEYYIELNDLDSGDTLDTHEILVYEEQDFTQGSTIQTYDSEGEERDNFDESKKVYFEGKIRDQYGHPPDEFQGNFWVNIYVQKEGEDRESLGQYQVDNDGNVKGDFRAWDRDGPGDYTLMMYDDTGEEEYARHAFTIIGVEIDIETEYTQGQDMEIRIESNFEQTVNIMIENDTGEVMENAEWTNQEFENELWIEEYTIPDDEPDGIYHVVVYSTDGEELDRKNFALKKYSLEATTEKRAYLTGETVETHYTVERLLDGSEAQDLDVEYRLMYYDEEYNRIAEEDNISYDNHFSFDVPDDMRVDTQLRIDLWANGSAEDHTTHWNNWVYVGELEASFDTDSNEYLQGQTIYVTGETFVRDQQWGIRSSVEDAQVTVDLKQEGESVGGYETTASTDGSGQVVIPIHLSTDITPGTYHLNVTAEKLDFEAYPDEKEIQVVDEVSRLNVLLERDKDSYSPGEEVNVSYVVTKQGELVDANVRYEVVGPSNKVYEKSYADKGAIRFTVPEDFNQDENLYLRVNAKVDQETKGSAIMEIPVSELELLLNADQTEYEGGEIISFEYELLGTDQTTSEVYKVIESPDERADIIEMNQTVENKFEFKVPEHPARTYEVRLEVVTGGGVRVVESLELQRVSRIQLEISIETDSSYTTDVYEPGDEIEVRYKLRALGDAKVPDKITIWYSFLGTGEQERIQTNSPEGTFTVEIPEVSEGTYFLQVGSNVNSQNLEPVSVEENPSPLSLRVVGGLSVLGLIGIIILFIILGLGYYTLSSPGTGRHGSKLSGLFKKEGKKEKSESEEKRTQLKSTEKSEEETSPAKEAHGWEGPEEEKGGEFEGAEDSDQIEPDEDL